jgi:regulator of sirC expression with transglutaminase-like and TPR domain
MSSVFIHPAEARRQFAEFASGDLTDRDLARGALLIALEEYPQLDLEGCLDQLRELGVRVARRLSAGEPDSFRLGHLQAVLFDQEGLTGNAVDYYDPRNGYLNEVLHRKVGLPITLSIIFLDVAARVGLSASGVGLPGHYLVKVAFELNEIYVDPFHGGSTLSRPEVARLMDEMSGGHLELRSEHLRAWGARETLVRVLANLHSIYTRGGDSRRAAAASERIAILARGSAVPE